MKTEKTSLPIKQSHVLALVLALVMLERGIDTILCTCTVQDPCETDQVEHSGYHKQPAHCSKAHAANSSHLYLPFLAVFAALPFMAVAFAVAFMAFLTFVALTCR